MSVARVALIGWAGIAVRKRHGQWAVLSILTVGCATTKSGGPPFVEAGSVALDSLSVAALPQCGGAEASLDLLASQPLTVSLSGLREGAIRPAVGSDLAYLHHVSETDAIRRVEVSQAVLEVPYWSSAFRRVGAREGERTYVAESLIFTIRVHGADGSLIDSIVEAPPGWRQARRPAAGEFGADNGSAWQAYLQSFDVIVGLAPLGPKNLAVVTGDLIAAVGSPMATMPSELHLYERSKYVGSIPIPGAHLVAYGTSGVFVCAGTSGDDSGVMKEFVINRGR